MLEFDIHVFQQVLDRAKLAVQAAQANLRKLEAERDTRLAELKAAVATAKERLTSARTTEDTAHKMYDRTKVLYDKQVVALADLELIQVRWDDAKTALSLAGTDLLRAEDALKNEALVIQALIDAARAQLGLALQDLAQAQRDMQNTKVPAPAVAVVSARKVNPGEWIKGPQTLFTIDRVEPIYATAQIEQEKSAYVSVGQDAEVVFDSYPTRIQRGRIYKIDPSIDPVRRTFKAYVLLQNPSLELRPGMAAFTRMKSSRRVTLVPRLAVINPTGAPSIEATVFVVENSKAVVRKVKLGKAEGLGRVEVLDGLRAGEWVVIYGNKDLNNGDLVNAEKVAAAKDVKKAEAR
jgi:RND family efflux transporter MFP subunit